MCKYLNNIIFNNLNNIYLNVKLFNLTGITIISISIIALPFYYIHKPLVTHGHYVKTRFSKRLKETEYIFILCN